MGPLGIRILGAVLFLSAAGVVSGAEGGLLGEARGLLKGDEKDLAGARSRLAALLELPAGTVGTEDLCYAYVYLGYIEDLEGHRAEAVGWFRKAMALEGERLRGIQSVARGGLRKPATWIRHLDEGFRPVPAAASRTQAGDRNVLDRIEGAVVLKAKPESVTLKENLSRAEMKENFECLVGAIDRHFSFFIIKDIAWDAVCERYRYDLEAVGDTPAFYRLLGQLVRELKDAHSWLEGFDGEERLEPYAPEISFRPVEGRIVAVDVSRRSGAYAGGVRPGWILTAVDDQPVEAYMESLRGQLPVSSSERNLRERLARMILCGERESRVKADFLTEAGMPLKGLPLVRTGRYPSNAADPAFALIRLDTVWYGLHRSGCGYIRINSFLGRMEIAEQFDLALERLRNTKGLILDIRDNTGGYGTSQKRIIERLMRERCRGAVTYTRSGPGHGDFDRREEFFEPGGAWQYEGPVGLLMNAVTGSASDLFAARLISTGRVTGMGQTTHGNVTGQGVYVQLPCGLVVRVSKGYVTDANGRVIEGNGNAPEIAIEPTLADVRRQVDGVLERAFMELLRAGDSS